MKIFKAFFIAFCMIFVAVCIISVSSVSEAKVSITVKNTTNKKVYLAFRWRGFDMPDDRRDGWYGVPAGETKTFTFKNIVYVFTADSFGYYAEGGGKVWAGKSSDGLGVIIHPTKNFEGHPEDRISGGKKVYFKPLSLKETGNTREDATGSIVLK
jgi:hypothetical protein